MSVVAEREQSEHSLPPTGSRRIDTRRLIGLADQVTTSPGENERIEVENPATGRLLATVPKCTGEDVEFAVQRAREAQASWRQSDWETRRRILLRLHDLVLDRQDDV